MRWTSPAQTQRHAQHTDSDLPENVSANGILPLFEHNGRLKFNYVMGCDEIPNFYSQLIVLPAVSALNLDWPSHLVIFF